MKGSSRRQDEVKASDKHSRKSSNKGQNNRQTSTQIKKPRIFQQLRYEDRFYWERYLIMHTIDLNDPELESRTYGLFQRIAENDFFRKFSNTKKFDNLQKKFESKKFNNVYQIFDDLLNSMIFLDKSAKVLEACTHEDISKQEAFQALYAIILSTYHGLYTLAIKEENSSVDFCGKSNLVYMEIEATIYSFSLSKPKRMAIFQYISNAFPEAMKDVGGNRFHFDLYSLNSEQAKELLKVVKQKKRSSKDKRGK